MMQFCHIAPPLMMGALSELPFPNNYNTPHRSSLLLAHLLDPKYNTNQAVREAYTQKYAHDFPRVHNILDNSAFEMYKANKPMYESERLLDVADTVNVRYIVMTDYPGQPSIETIRSAIKMAPEIKSRVNPFNKQNYGTFFVPQSEVGAVSDYVNAFSWAAQAEEVDYIGVSILGVPNAFAVEKDNKLQRFMSRWKMMSILEDKGILREAHRNGKKIHFLGMVDGPNEIELVIDYHIDTWDSSAAVWAGYNQISFDQSPTGLLLGKFEKEVDFDVDMDPNSVRMKYIQHNIYTIEQLVSKHNMKVKYS